eukprot:1067981-Rhodomonas_salina.1
MVTPPPGINPRLSAPDTTCSQRSSTIPDTVHSKRSSTILDATYSDLAPYRTPHTANGLAPYQTPHTANAPPAAAPAPPTAVATWQWRALPQYRTAHSERVGQYRTLGTPPPAAPAVAAPTPPPT